MARILVAEDDASTRKLMCAVLKRVGFEVLEACDGLQALDMLDGEQVDLLLTDVMMPGLDGMQLVSQLREARFDLPILMVTAKGAPVDRRQGFLVGTDDYLVKPVDAQEMVLRIRALLRRARIVADERIVVGNVRLEYTSLEVRRVGAESAAGEADGPAEGASFTLPPKEFYLLYKLLSYPDQVFTRMQLFDEVWGAAADSDPATVSVHINRLRNRFADWPEFSIETVRGVGYKAVLHE